ncbi:MAG: tyrosine-type recombinase/integrase [Armatimonadota bacterium]|nr:tyrosine-type recombinase/integrase [Armatimonadota bacterium]
MEAFLLTKRVGGCTEKTLAMYRWWLDRLVREVQVPDPVGVRKFFVRLSESGVSHSTQHQAFRVFRVFFRWALNCGAMTSDPLRGFTMRTPKTLPQVPTVEEVRAVLASCPDTFEGVRNRAMILVLADSGLRANELLNLLVEHWSPADRSLFVRSGKGRKDRVVFVGATTTRALKEWLARHPAPAPESYLFTDRQGKRVKHRHLVTLLHRLSARAGLPEHRWLHPHALRHFAATSWLREGMGLDEVRRLLGHETLHTTLRYSSLVSKDLQQAHKKASAVDRTGLGEV